MEQLDQAVGRVGDVAGGLDEPLLDSAAGSSSCTSQ